MEIPKDLDSIADRQERQGAKIFFRALKSQYAELAKQYENGQDLQPNKTVIKNALISFHNRAQLEMADWQYNRLLKENPVKALQVGLYERILGLVRTWVTLNIGGSINSISNTTLDLVRKVISDGQDQGFGARKIGKLIRDEAKDKFTAYRSTVIARTEGTRAASQGAKFGAEQWEVITGQKKWKGWSANNSPRTRDSHIAMIGSKPIPGDQDFIVGGTAMSGPGDPRGGKANVISCRCRMYYMSERAARQILGLKPVAKPVEFEEVEKPVEASKPYELTEAKIKALEKKGVIIKGEAKDINKVIGGFDIEEFDKDMLTILKDNGVNDVQREYTNFKDAVILSYRSKGNADFELVRFFRANSEGRTVEHNLFKISKDLQGSGISKKTFKSLYKQYEAADIATINVHANIDVGGYAWAKYGFEPAKGSTIYDDAKKAVRKKYGANSPEELDLTNIIASNNESKLHKIANTKYGKDALLGSDWEGSLNLKNKVQRKIFEDYLR